MMHFWWFIKINFFREAELVTMLNEHYYGKDDTAAPEPVGTTTAAVDDDDDDDLDFGDVGTSSKDESVDSDKVKELLDTLD